jgi:hypothetical protein
LRHWAFFSRQAVSGSRPDALIQLKVEHYDAAAVTGAGVGPTLILEPLKALDEEEFRNKALGEAAYPLQVWLACLEQLHGGPLPQEYPLFPISIKHLGRGWSYQAVWQWWVGHDDEVPTRRTKALMPVADDLHFGFAPHRPRATAAQQLETPRMQRYIEERGIDKPIRFFSEILLDHKLSESVEAAYKLAGTPVKEMMAGAAIAFLWESLTTDRGARWAPDADGYRQRLRVYRATDDQRRKLLAELERHGQRHAAGTLTNDAYYRESTAALVRLGQLASDIAELKFEIQRIEDNDPMTVRAFDDDKPMPVVDLSRIKREVFGHAEGFTHIMGSRVRNWYTPKEFARLSAVTPKQVGIWLDDDNPTMPPGLPPWTTTKAPVEVLSARRRRILADYLNSEWIDANPRRRQLGEEMLSEWPAEANWHRYRDREATAPKWLQEEAEPAFVSRAPHAP